MIGQRVSHYLITAKLGSGGMGVVYEAEDEQLGRHVALKFLPTDWPRTIDAGALPARGARRLGAEPSRHLHRLTRSSSTRASTSSSWSCSRARPLAERIRRERIPIETARWRSGSRSPTPSSRRTPRASCTATSSRPTSSSTTRGQVKILDFGLAKIEPSAQCGRTSLSGGDRDALRRELTIAGVDHRARSSYMSPEQARGQLTDARTDLFSLGAVLYQMATGKLPFQGDTSAVVFDSILNREPAPLGAGQSRPAAPSSAASSGRPWRRTATCATRPRPISRPTCCG